MQWKINYYYNTNNISPIKKWLDSLDNEPKAEIFKIFQMLSKYGIDLGLPFVRPIESKIYEVRAKDKSGIYRVLYFAHTDKTFVLLHGFMKKTQKTPRKEIEIALKRMKEVKDG
ncbi:type II toxin-antitoxin system RelE/ParE family toxin [Sulfurimonas sp.]|jgi:phage-related protein|uniref:type II toxin-antitoxin system RelE/ParE family toxin n=1 Tax=Sulfurimonas sp. TaxID=2022749 RepID=UPI002A3600F7|nr:type II toxin-antitoxin system RelE/ParE family toxin [Sulfurimonas sp.]MDY0122938.1 type II toxin-antitoxin system RelE/ParE family toxin [Sulfurimonas sp.]